MNNNHLFSDRDQINILIVDDEQLIQKIVARTMNSAGYETCIASDGEHAFKLLKESFFDIVITDIGMPKMDGIELTNRIVEYFPADVIVMTGQINQYNYDQLVGAGASDFVQKPFTPDEILLRVKRVLRERKLKEDLLKFHKDLAHSQKLESIGQLSAGIVHEINTPVAFVASNVQFVKDSLKDLNEIINNLRSVYEAAINGDLNAKFLEKVQSNLDFKDLEYLQEEIPAATDQTSDGVNRIIKIIKAMQVLSHPGKKEHIYFNLNRCIKDVVTISKNEWKYVSDLVLDLDENLPEVSCNPSEINQVLLNLLVNASHAISDKIKSESLSMGKIKIQTKINGDWVEIAISDTGNGIPEDLIPKIFNPFFTTKEIGKGTGQGLAITRSIIVDRHNGKIDVRTSEGNGTTFLIKLPTHKNNFKELS